MFIYLCLVLALCVREFVPEFSNSVFIYDPFNPFVSVMFRKIALCASGFEPRVYLI